MKCDLPFLTFLRLTMAACAGASASSSTFADDSVLWDLSRNEIPPALWSGAVEKVDGVVRLRDGAAFAVPADAFPDQANFTVQVTLSLDALVQDAVFTAMRKQSEGDLGGRADYPLEAARRVLFLEDIYLSATSLKGTAEDAFGVEWKLKWGDEASIEPVATRLYLLAGGKATDLVYSNSHGPEAMVLVLMDPEKAEKDRQDEKDDERYPTTLEELKASVDEFLSIRSISMLLTSTLKSSAPFPEESPR